jgi:hypothetical protein
MFATLSDMFSGGKNLPRWSRTVAAMMGGGSLCTPTLSAFVELETSGVNGDVLSRINQTGDLRSCHSEGDHEQTPANHCPALGGCTMAIAMLVVSAGLLLATRKGAGR